MTKIRNKLIEKWGLSISLEALKQADTTLTGIVRIKIGDDVEYWAYSGNFSINHVYNFVENAKVILPTPQEDDVIQLARTKKCEYTASFKPNPFLRGRGIK